MQQYMQNPSGYCNPAGPYRLHIPSLPPKGPSQTVFFNPIQPHIQTDKPRSCSTNVLIEEQPSWLDDLLNEPDIPVNKGHRRSSSDPFMFSKANISSDEHRITPINTIPTPRHELRDYELWKKSSSTCMSLPKGVDSTEEDADLRALGMSCSSPLKDGTISSENGTRNQVDGAENPCNNGSETSQTKCWIPPPPGLKNDAKRKQQNARRSRVRKLEYIGELERNVQALQVHGAEVSAQLEFLDQQNLILGMENRALKQRLESLSQVYLIKSMEQEILDRELGRLQYLHQCQNLGHQRQRQQQQRQKQNPGVHRRAQSCDINSKFANLGVNVPDPISTTNNGFQKIPQ